MPLTPSTPAPAGTRPEAPTGLTANDGGASSPSFTAGALPYVIAAFRAVIGGLFACHGAASVFGVFAGPMGGGTVPQFAWPAWFAAVIQLVCGCLVLAGLGTRGAALLASGSMAYAYFTVHLPQGLVPLENHGEPAAVFCWTFFLLAFTGPGAFALDGLFRRSR
jgi:putative oxidoreductase